MININDFDRAETLISETTNILLECKSNIDTYRKFQTQINSNIEELYPYMTLLFSVNSNENKNLRKAVVRTITLYDSLVSIIDRMNKRMKTT